MHYQLNPVELSYARQIGTARCQAKDESIRQNRAGWHKSSDRSYPHQIGAMAEVAWSRLTGDPVDETTGRWTGDGVDFVDVEIKAITFAGKDPHLKVRCEEFTRKRPSYYVLAYVNPLTGHVGFLGYATREKFERLKEVKDYGFGKNYILHGDSLDSIESLVRKKRLDKVQLVC